LSPHLREIGISSQANGEKITMADVIQSPAEATYWFIQGWVLFSILSVLGTACFAWIVAKRLTPLLRAQRDPRFDRPLARLWQVLRFWLGQWKHPRYKLAGILHILIFAGFIILAVRAFSLLFLGFSSSFVMPGFSGETGRIYDTVKDYAATLVILCMIFAIVRRLVFRPARYAVPPERGKAHTADAIFLLALIGILMLADGLFEASKAAAESQAGHHAPHMAALSLPWALTAALAPAPLAVLSHIHLGAFLLHELTFFFLLCYRPFGIQFHVETSLFSIYFAKLDRGRLKPVRWGVPDDQLDQVKSFGVKTFEDFTWKQMLDFYSCADCGRCSDQCPSHAVGRPLSPRFFTTKARDYSFRHYPVLGSSNNGTPLAGTLYSEDEIWSCTTCGACEAECPLLIEYIDKIVDLRRGLVDEGRVPQSLQKPLKALASRGNPFGKPEKKRAEWTKNKELLQTCNVKVLNGDGGADALYFVDSITSFDDRIQSIGRATARILSQAGENFGILGPGERDSGNEVRRFGEEMLFQSLKESNTEAIRSAGVQRIVTADPHAYNALRRDYHALPPVEHISEAIARHVESGAIRLRPVADDGSVYAYHDPCYLGRHNGIYDAPRNVLDAIPGLKRVEMSRCRDRSFCCGGGGLALFYEPKEEQRMGVQRVRMAADAGANVIVTACPFCMVNVEDAIKVAGLEGRITAIDLTELVDRQMVREMAGTESTVVGINSNSGE
jgi:Fe-S oxidoreductase